ncbi:MAG: S41 family peptidase [Gemmatales bacterium]
MLRSLLLSLALAITVLAANQPQAAEPGMNVRLVNNPALSPDGQWIAFDWNGDIWLAGINGGNVKQLTTHPGRDRDPKFSPDGKTIAFISDREAGNQIFTIPVEGGTPKQITFNTAGYTMLGGWGSGGKNILASGLRDHYWTGRGAERFFLINTEKREAEVPLFDDYGSNASLSPDGKKVLFTREGHSWTRKGYHGTQASQIWMYDLESKKFTPVIMGEWDARWPLWKADGQGFYFVGVPDGKAGVGAAPNLWEMSADGKKTQLTKFEQDSVAFPTMSKDGKTIVFRQLFDLYSYTPGSDKTPQKITLTYNGDRPIEKIQRRSLTTATSVAFSNDGLDVAFIAGGDLWVMDTELREPVQITKSPDEEHSPVFSPDNERILLVSDQGGQSDIWQVERADKTKYWFQNTSFKMTKLTNDAETESNIKFSPDGTKIAYTKGRGDIVISDADGKNPKTFVKGFNPPQYEWSPDSKWMVYATEDNDFNSDIFIAPLDGSREPYNLSRHPFEDRNPTWSPDGKIIAFTSRRNIEETDIYYVYLTKDPEETGTRERSLEKALEKMNRGRRSSTFTPPAGGTPGKTDPGKEPSKEPTKDPVKDPTKPQTDPAKKQGDDDQDQPPRGRRPGGGGPPGAGADPAAGAAQGAGPAVVDDSPIRPLKITKVEIDFDGLADRLHRISIPNSNESNLFWSPDGKKLAFSATIGGTTGIHTVEFPDSLTPKSLNLPSVGQPRWIRNSQIVGSIGGVPSSIAVGATGATPTSFRFTALQKVDLPAKHAAAFDLAWRTMRDNFYDGKLGNNDWNAIRTKYLGMAGEAIDPETLGTVVSLMLGELNGSHLGFTVGRLTAPTPGTQPGDPTETTGTWREQTMHLGVRFDPSFAGPGLKVRDVLPKGPASLKKSKLEAGEIVLAINGTPVDPKLDLSTVLNLPPNTDVTLKVKNAKGEERDVKIRPMAIAAARTLLYDKWLEDNRAMVDKASGGKLGYLHISGMSMPTFWKFQEELFSAGNGKDGLIIDVRENGGGSTADHLLTALTQPVHALTIPRGGTQVGYPIDRKVYASWNKPIVVMCNQNSFSNAEIFSHAIKTLKRGHIVGVTTAGGVISTGGTSIMDVGFLHLPFRGWYLVNDGQDMELNGCVPDVELWPAPGEMPQGKDAQLMKAVEVLSKDVADWKAQPRPKLTKATDRK